MRIGTVISAAIHVGLLALIAFGLPQAEPYVVEENEAFDVELVPFAEIPTTRLGSRDAEVQEQASVIETENQDTTEGQFQGNAERDLNEAPTEDPNNLDVREQIAAPDVSEPGPDEQPVPEPTARPEPAAAETPAEDQPEPQPEEAETPPAEEATPEESQAAPEAEVAEETVPEEASEPEEAATPAPPAPTPRPRPREIQTAAANFRQQRAQEAERDAERNPDAISQAINRQQVSGGGTQSSNQQAALGSQSGRTNVSLTQSEEDSLRRQIQPCWNPPIGVANSDQLRVSMRFSLERDGSVSTNPAVVNSQNRASFPGNAAAFRAAASAAQRAILRCAPYQMPPEKYEAWSEVIVNFDPREMF